MTPTSDSARARSRGRRAAHEVVKDRRYSMPNGGQHHRLAPVPAAVRLKRWVEPIPPASRLAPRTRSRLPITLPVNDALTTASSPLDSGEQGDDQSAALPKVALRSPPIPGRIGRPGPRSPRRSALPAEDRQPRQHEEDDRMGGEQRRRRRPPAGTPGAAGASQRRGSNKVPGPRGARTPRLPGPLTRPGSTL